MKAALIVAVTMRLGVVQLPPAGASTSPLGSPLVASMLAPNVVLSNVSVHYSGNAEVSVKVMAAIGGSMVVTVNGTAKGAATTAGGAQSSSSGEAVCDEASGGSGVGVLSSITAVVSTIAKGRPVTLF